MPIRTRTSRVFVSSTFTNRKAERNALQHKAESGKAPHEVFPKLSFRPGTSYPSTRSVINVRPTRHHTRPCLIPAMPGYERSDKAHVQTFHFRQLLS
jgi:hypothetical protein